MTRPQAVVYVPIVTQVITATYMCYTPNEIKTNCGPEHPFLPPPGPGSKKHRPLLGNLVIRTPPIRRCRVPPRGFPVAENWPRARREAKFQCLSLDRSYGLPSPPRIQLCLLIWLSDLVSSGISGDAGPVIALEIMKAIREEA